MGLRRFADIEPTRFRRLLAEHGTQVQVWQDGWHDVMRPVSDRDELRRLVMRLCALGYREDAA